MDHRILELLLQGKGVKAVCKRLKVGKDRVREVREKARAFGYLDGSAAIPIAPLALFPEIRAGRRLDGRAASLQ